MHQSIPPIAGHCDERFARVREAFEANFARRHEHGGAVAVVVEGETVVNLRGGWADEARSTPWRADTLVSAQSTTKGLIAGLLHRLVDQRRMRWDNPVARYWPEFAQAGKEKVTVRQLASHQAGLCIVESPLPPGATLRWRTMLEALERQRPVWPPGQRFGYHAVTWSYLVGGLIERVTGQPLAEAFHAMVAEPWGLDFLLGIDQRERHRTADLLPSDPAAAPPAGKPSVWRERAFSVAPRTSGGGPNSDAARSVPVNGHGTALAVARYYGGLADDGVLEGSRFLAPGRAAEMGRTEVVGLDAVLGTERRFGLGFWLHYPTRMAARGARSFGHPGMGGSFGIADPDRRLGIGYLMNRPGAFLRAANLELAVYRCLSGRAAAGGAFPV